MTCNEAVANICKENYPEDKLTEDEQDLILEELGRVLCWTPKGELLHLRSFRQEGLCTDKQSSQCLIKAIDNHRLGSGARLKATVGRNLIKAVEVILRTKNKIIKSLDELL